MPLPTCRTAGVSDPLLKAAAGRLFSTFARETALMYRTATMRLKRLTPQAFDRVAADTRMGDQAREMARAVLVDGRAQVDVATEYGMSKQRVSGAVATIERAYKKTTTPGVSSIRVELDLPETLALELAALAEAMKGCDDAARCAEALDKATNAVRKAAKLLVAAP